MPIINFVGIIIWYIQGFSLDFQKIKCYYFFFHED